MFHRVPLRFFLAVMAAVCSVAQTWTTDLLNTTAINEHTRSLLHPFVTVNPQKDGELISVTFERPAPGSAHLWRGNPKTLKFTYDRNLLDLPKIEGDPNVDFGYAWLVPTEANKALVFYYHGRTRGPNPIWVFDTTF